MVRAPPPQGLEIGKTYLQFFFNNPRSSIKPENAPDPNLVIMLVIYDLNYGLTLSWIEVDVGEMSEAVTLAVGSKN